MGPQRKWWNVVGETEITTGQNSKMCLEENTEYQRVERQRVCIEFGESWKTSFEIRP